MSFIYKRNKLFGLVNIFDLLFIILILFLLAPQAAILYSRYRGKNITGEPLPYRHIYKNAKAVTYAVSEVADRIRIGDAAWDRNGSIEAEIITIISDTPAQFKAGPIEEDAGLMILSDEMIEYTAIGVTGEKENDIPAGIALEKKEKKVAISSIRRIEAELKILCKVERGDELTIAQQQKPFLNGQKFILKTGDYSTEFTITEIIE